MEHTSADTVIPDEDDAEILEYLRMQQNPSPNTKLFSFLVLLNAYIPESFLPMSACKRILGPADPIHGDPPFKNRMKPFSAYISASSPGNGCVKLTHPEFAQDMMKALADLGISRSATVKSFMFSLCRDRPPPYILNIIKGLLTKRTFGVKGKARFSQLIEEIIHEENFYKAVSVLKMASNKFRQYHIFPQTISRLYYSRGRSVDYDKAEEWARTAIERAPKNSYVADTLGQVCKRRLMKEAFQPNDILYRAEEAFREFKNVEMKADREEGQEDTAGTVNTSNTFNNRGLFGFIQVAKIASEKLKKVTPFPTDAHESFVQNLKTEVTAKFDFFEWYLTYSKPGMTSVEPDFFWKDVVLCYEDYTMETAAESTSFPGLLDCLNHGLFTSKGRRAGFEEAQKSVSDLEAIRDDLKTIYDANADDVKAAESYILSNIILSNKMHDSPHLTPVRELQTIICRLLGTDVGRRSSEFYLLVVLLFWLEDQPQPQEDNENMEQKATEDLMFEPDLQQQVTFMERAFERAEYAKYLRGRYLLPLFFLGEGSGLSKWIHKSRLDAIVEEKVDAELADQIGRSNKKKLRRINEMWVMGEVWHVPEIQDILRPVQVELCTSPTMPQEQRVFVCAGGKKIMATIESESVASGQSPTLFYLGFTIQGPVVFKA